MSAEFRAFLLDPAAEAPEPRPGPTLEAVALGFANLLAGGSASSMRVDAERWAGPVPGVPAARLLAAQAAWLLGDRPAALGAVRGLADAHPDWLAAALLRARLEELSGEVRPALETYRRIAARNAAAAERAAALAAQAAEFARRELEEDLGRGDVVAATPDLDLLLAVAADDPRTHELAARLAAAQGDGDAELAALRRLAASSGDEFEPMPLSVRRAELEIERGAAADGLRILEGLAERDPRNPEVREALADGKFRWRLQLLPEAVRQAAALPALSRADLARLLFWLIPEVRAARPEAARIVVDVLDHPAREEIVRVVNLELLAVDDRLRAFSPDRVATRGDGLQALLRVQRLRRAAPACLRGAPAAGVGSMDGTCSLAAQCGWIAEVAGCLAGEPLASADFLRWIHRGLGDGEAAPR